MPCKEELESKVPECIVRSHYEPRLAKYREGYEILDWENREAQLARFRILSSRVELNGRAILDVGCGVGELFSFLSQAGIRCRYTGIDILPGMIHEAERRHPDARFLAGDIIGGDPFPEERFDVVFCSGVFNLCMGDNYEYLSRALDSFLAVADHTVIFNLLSCESRDKDEKYFYYVPDKVSSILRAKDIDVEIIDGYLPNDFTVVCSLTPPG